MHLVIFSGKSKGVSTKGDLKCEWMDVNVCNTASIGDTERPMKSQQPRADDFETAARAGPTTGISRDVSE